MAVVGAKASQDAPGAKEGALAMLDDVADEESNASNVTKQKKRGAKPNPLREWAKR